MIANYDKSTNIDPNSYVYNKEQKTRSNASRFKISINQLELSNLISIGYLFRSLLVTCLHIGTYSIRIITWGIKLILK
jgi:hypothetical protein